MASRKVSQFLSAIGNVQLTDLLGVARESNDENIKLLVSELVDFLDQFICMPTYSVLEYAEEMTLDFDGTCLQEVELEGDCNFIATDNRTPDANTNRRLSLIVYAGDTDRFLGFNQDWRFVREPPPSYIPAGTYGVLCLWSRSTTEAAILAVWTDQSFEPFAP
jgi:hypothetical protein